MPQLSTNITDNSSSSLDLHNLGEVKLNDFKRRLMRRENTPSNILL